MPFLSPCFTGLPASLDTGRDSNIPMPSISTSRKKIPALPRPSASSTFLRACPGKACHQVHTGGKRYRTTESSSCRLHSADWSQGKCHRLDETKAYRSGYGLRPPGCSRCEDQIQQNLLILLFPSWRRGGGDRCLLGSVSSRG
jgi:hypothetical protein